MKTIFLPTFVDEGRLISTQDDSTIPFVIKRVFIISAVDGGAVRGKHAHKKTKQVLFCIQGSVTVTIDNGKTQKTYRLSAPNKGVFIDRMVWSEMREFSPDAILLVFASDYFREADYIRRYDDFVRRLK